MPPKGDRIDADASVEENAGARDVASLFNELLEEQLEEQQNALGEKEPAGNSGETEPLDEEPSGESVIDTLAETAETPNEGETGKVEEEDPEGGEEEDDSFAGLPPGAKKSINRLTRQKKELREELSSQREQFTREIAELKNQVSQGEEAPVDVTSIETIEELQKVYDDARAGSDYVSEALFNDPKEDAETGEEYLVDFKGNKLNRKDLQGMQRKAMAIQRDIRDRYTFLESRHKWAQQAAETFDFLRRGSDTDSELFGIAQKLTKDPNFAVVYRSTPASPFLLGVATLGVRELARMRKAQSDTSNGKSPAKTIERQRPKPSASAGDVGVGARQVSPDSDPYKDFLKGEDRSVDAIRSMFEQELKQG